jgi:hypothetical protein
VSGHTPGPWRYFRGTHSVWSVEKAICIMAGPHKRECEERDANARLIAAAPDLLEALQMLYSETADYIRLNNLGGIDNQCMQLSRAAIAKATGEGA